MLFQQEIVLFILRKHDVDTNTFSRNTSVGSTSNPVSMKSKEWSQAWGMPLNQTKVARQACCRKVGYFHFFWMTLSVTCRRPGISSLIWARPFPFCKGHFHWKIWKSMWNFWRGAKTRGSEIHALGSLHVIHVMIGPNQSTSFIWLMIIWLIKYFFLNVFYTYYYHHYVQQICVFFFSPWAHRHDETWSWRSEEHQRQT